MVPQGRTRSAMRAQEPLKDQTGRITSKGSIKNSSRDREADGTESSEQATPVGRDRSVQSSREETETTRRYRGGSLPPHRASDCLTESTKNLKTTSEYTQLKLAEKLINTQPHTFPVII